MFYCPASFLFPVRQLRQAYGSVPDATILMEFRDLLAMSPIGRKTDSDMAGPPQSGTVR
jgi:hypothetical protein